MDIWYIEIYYFNFFKISTGNIFQSYHTNIYKKASCNVNLDEPIHEFTHSCREKLNSYL